MYLSRFYYLSGPRFLQTMSSPLTQREMPLNPSPSGASARGECKADTTLLTHQNTRFHFSLFPPADFPTFLGNWSISSCKNLLCSNEKTFLNSLSDSVGITLGGLGHLLVTVTAFHSLSYNHSRAALKFISKQEKRELRLPRIRRSWVVVPEEENSRLPQGRVGGCLPH